MNDGLNLDGVEGVITVSPKQQKKKETMKSPRVRIIMPVYNGERFIGAAIDSILAQTFEDWELVIVDDGSMDATSEIVRRYDDARIQVIRQENAGPEAARQRGFARCTARYVARMDADDEMTPRRLEMQVAYLERHPDTVAVGGQIMYMSEDGRRRKFRSSWPLLHDDILKRFRAMQGGFCNATIMCRSEVQDRVNPTRQGGPGADVGFVLQLSALGKIANLSAVVHYVRIHDDSIQSSKNPLGRIERTRYALVCEEKKLEGLPEPSWDSFHQTWLSRSLSCRIIEMHYILMGRLARQAMWYSLNDPIIPHSICLMFLTFLLAPLRTLRRALRWMHDKRELTTGGMTDLTACRKKQGSAHSPVVRIIMPVYNGERFVGAAIESVLSQTFQDWELVVVDDGCTDATPEIVQRFSDKRIRLLRQENAGDEAARQRGFQGCRAEFVARMDADDIMVPDRLERQVRYLRAHPEVGIVGGQIMYVSEDGTKAGFRSNWPLHHDRIVKKLLALKGSICNSTIMLRREIQERITPTPLGGPGADVGFVLQAAMLGRLSNMTHVLNYVRIHDRSIQSSYNPMGRLKRESYSVLCCRGMIFGDFVPSWEDFSEEWEQRSLLRVVADWRKIVIGKVGRKAMWCSLNGPFFPHAFLFMALSSLICPIKVVKRCIDWLPMQGKQRSEAC